MESMYNSSRRSCVAYFLACVFSAIGFFFFLSLLDAARSSSLSQGGKEILGSKWGTSALVDYIVGASFGAMYVYLRQGPSVLCIPSALFAIMLPFIGNFALLWYISFLLVKEGDLTMALFPETEQGLPTNDESIERQGSKNEIRFFTALFSVLLVFFLFICIRAIQGEDLMEGYKIIKSSKWTSVTFLDNLIGLVFTAVYVMIREGTTSVILPLWLLSFILLGNLPTCLYALIMVKTASDSNKPLRTVVLSKKYNDYLPVLLE